MTIQLNNAKMTRLIIKNQLVWTKCHEFEKEKILQKSINLEYVYIQRIGTYLAI